MIDFYEKKLLTCHFDRFGSSSVNQDGRGKKTRALNLAISIVSQN